MKYIDADKLKAEINKRYREYRTKSKGDKYYEGMADSLDYFEQFIDSLQHEQPEEICSKCIHHRKNDDCYYPYGGMQWRINENGVYECTGFCEKEQKRPEVDLEKEIKNKKTILLDLFGPMNGEQSLAIRNFARYFYELGRKGGSK